MEREDELYHVEKVIAGDLASFSYLVDKYKQRAYTLALRIVRNEQDAEEVSQDAFLKAFRSLNKFKRQSSFSTWLYRIVYNTALSRIRKKRIDTVSLDEEYLELSVDNTSQAYSTLVNEDRKKFLNIAIGELSEEESTLIDLYYNHEKPMDEIGIIMSLSHVNVRVKLLRTRKKLHICLDKLLKTELKDIL